LYEPRSLVKDSTMPPFRFLFEKRRIERGLSPDALPLTGSLAPPPGFEIIPTAEARSLVAYLISLRGDVPLFNAPLTVPVAAPAATNAPGVSPGSTNAAPTNAPAK
jgi:cytochrome c oxidase cbb3-type subunit 2